MSRWIPALALASLAFAQQPAPPNPPQKELKTQRNAPPAAGTVQAVPPEEDKALAASTEYSFNPLQSVKDVNVGNQYFKNHKYRAAELRYTSATRWNDGNAEAWLHLGEVEERLRDADKAKAAYQKYLDLAATDKHAAEIRKKLAHLK
jgi:tetratricopeptide (TPR) repeat protein